MANVTCRTIWWALVASLLVYMGVATVATPPPAAYRQAPLLALLLGFIAAAIGVGTLIYRRRALSEPIQPGRLDPSTPEGMQRAFPPFIVNLVLSESVGIYGLVLSLLSGQPAWAVAFGGTAIVLMVLHRPTAPDLQPPMSAHRP